MTGHHRHLRGAGGALAILLATVFAVALPARAAVAAPVGYAALGDSYSSGVGTGRFDLAGPPCLRGSLAYPSLWAAAHPGVAVSLQTCSGASIAQVRTQQVPHIPTGTTLVTVTMGGNDIGFSPVLTTCGTVTSDGLCLAAVTLAEGLALTRVPVELALTLSAIHHRAPHARIVILGYPHLFEVPGVCPAGVPDAVRRAAINRGTDLLIASLSHTARLFRATFVDVRGRFAGHGVCAPTGQAWITGPDRGTEAFHPTADGHAHGYLPALESVTG